MALAALWSQRTRSMCGGLVLFWVLTRPHTFRNCTHNENTYCIDIMILGYYSGY